MLEEEVEPLAMDVFLQARWRTPTGEVPGGIELSI